MANIRSFITTLCVFIFTLFILAFGVLERPNVIQNVAYITTSALKSLQNTVTEARSNIPVLFTRDIDFVGLEASGKFGIALCLPGYRPSITLPFLGVFDSSLQATSLTSSIIDVAGQPDATGKDVSLLALYIVHCLTVI
jgi:hypothetical protein